MEFAVGAGFVLAFGVAVDGRAQQAVEQDVARIAVERVGLGHPLLELDVAVQAPVARGGGGQADEVGLHRAGDQDGIGPLGLRLAEIEFQLAHLVAAQCETRAVVALDQQRSTAQGLGQAGHGFQRGRRVAQAHARQVFEFPQLFQIHQLPHFLGTLV